MREQARPETPGSESESDTEMQRKAAAREMHLAGEAADKLRRVPNFKETHVLRMLA